MRRAIQPPVEVHVSQVRLSAIRPAARPPCPAGRVWAQVAWVGLLLGWAAPAVAAQAPSAAATQPAKGGLDPAYVDGSFGFSIRPPAGSTGFREKQTADSGDLEIVRFVNVPLQWSLAVRLSTTTRPLDVKATVEGITGNLGARNKDLEVLRGEAARVAGRDGVRYAASFTAEGTPWLRQQAVTPARANEYFVIVFIAPMSDREAAEAVFDKVVASFEILRDERAQARIQAALDRGAALLKSATGGRPDVAAHVVEESYLRCLMSGRDIGFVRINERATVLDHRKGVQIREWGWLFNLDGSITHLQQDMFLSADLSFERWENRIHALPAAAPDATPVLLIDLENAIRQDDQLGVAYLPKPNSPDKKDKVIRVEPSYASAAWNVLFPRLVDLQKPETYAFSLYKSDRRGLVLQTLEVIGPAQTLVNGQTISTIKIEDSEGLLPPKTETYVDRQGRIVRVVAGQLEMVATTREFVETTYTAKVTDAQNLFKKLMGIQSPPPAPPAPESKPRAPRSGGAPSGRK